MSSGRIEKAHASRSSSLLGFALSLRESSTAFLNAAVWATMIAVVLICVEQMVDYWVGETCVVEERRMKTEQVG